jgi:hypothetical protein
VRSRRSLAAAGVVAALLAVLAAWLLLRGGVERPPPSPAPALEVGLEDDAVFLNRYYYRREVAFDQARQLGVTRLRVLVGWAKVLGASAEGAVPPARPVYGWAPFDDLHRAAKAHGIRLELVLTGPAPGWATADGRVGAEQPDPAPFARFAAAAARHFRGRVDRYSIWNEPNYVSWISPASAAPRIYRDLYAAGYRAIKLADPSARVLIGETAPYAQPGRATAPLAFLRRLACVDRSYRPTGRCTPLRADGYAHHPYDFERAPEEVRPGADDVTIGSLARLTAALDRLGETGTLRTPAGRPLDVHLTEFGYFRRGKRALPESTRAAYLQRAFEIASRNRRVRQMLQYLLVSPPTDSPSAFFDTAVITLAGRPEKPFVALAAWAREALRARRIRAPAGAGSPGGGRP